MRIQSSKQPWRRRLRLPAVASMFVGCLVVVLTVVKLDVEGTLATLPVAQSADQQLSNNLATVVRAPMHTQVSAYGELRSTTQRNIVNLVDGRVAAIYQSEGAFVTPDTTLVSLENPLLSEKLALAEQDLLLAEANAKNLIAELQEKSAQLQYELELAQGQLRLVETELAAKTQLFNERIISELDLKRQKQQVENATLKIRLLNDRLASLDSTSKTRTDTSNLKVEQAQAKVAIAQRNVALLTIKSEIDGILQRLDDSIFVGDWLNTGRQVATVANAQSLYAEVKVNASSIVRLAPGQACTLNIKGITSTGKVSRIAPRVENNQVTLDIQLQGDLPSTALPFVEVTATIRVELGVNVLQVAKPAYLDVKQGHAELYVRPAGAEDFVWKKVVLGRETATAIEIKSGLRPGDQVALTVEN